MKDVRLTLIYYSIAKKFIYKFVQNDRTRISVECSMKDTCCTWRLYATTMIHSTRFAIKIHNPNHTYGGDTGIDGHRRASMKWVASSIQNILKNRPTYRACDTRKDFKALYGVTLKFGKVWWGTEWHKMSFMY